MSDTQFGLREGKIVHIKDINPEMNGLKCGCVCPRCGEKLVARMGSIAWCFAHYSKTECLGGDETALHHLAKEILLESPGIVLPQLDVLMDVHVEEGYCLFSPDEGKGTTVRLKSPWIISFQDTDDEVTIGPYRADVVGYDEVHSYALEIKVTHAVDYEKRLYFIENQINCIEIDLGWFYEHPDEYSYPSLKDAILKELSCKKWLSFHSTMLIPYKVAAFEEYQKERKEYLEEEAEYLLELEEEKHQWEQQEALYAKQNEKQRNAIIKACDPVFRKQNMVHWTKRYFSDKGVQKMHKMLHVNPESLPPYMRMDLMNAYAFKCDPRHIQTILFYTYVFKHRDNEWKVKGVCEWIRKDLKFYCANPLIYPYKIARYSASLDKYIFEYFLELTKIGFLSCPELFRGDNPNMYHTTFTNRTSRTRNMHRRIEINKQKRPNIATFRKERRKPFEESNVYKSKPVLWGVKDLFHNAFRKLGAGVISQYGSDPYSAFSHDGFEQFRNDVLASFNKHEADAKEAICKALGYYEKVELFKKSIESLFAYRVTVEDAECIFDFINTFPERLKDEGLKDAGEILRFIEYFLHPIADPDLRKAVENLRGECKRIERRYF